MRATDKTLVLTLLGRPELRDCIASDTVPRAKLCTKCENIDFFAEKVQITDTFQELNRDASLCDFCKMRWILGKDSFSQEVRNIVFDLVGSDLQLNHRPVISLLACHEDSGASFWPCHKDMPRPSVVTNLRLFRRFRARHERFY